MITNIPIYAITQVLALDNFLTMQIIEGIVIHLFFNTLTKADKTKA